MPVQPVTDVRSSAHDQIARASELIRRSPHRRKVFEAIYKRQKKVKTVEDLMELTITSREGFTRSGGSLR